jgi:hypothetical protein
MTDLFGLEGDRVTTPANSTPKITEKTFLASSDQRLLLCLGLLMTASIQVYCFAWLLGSLPSKTIEDGRPDQATTVNGGLVGRSFMRSPQI